MKRNLIVMALLLTLATTANAAVETGDLDLNFGFSWSSEDGTSTSSGGTNPDRKITDFSFGVDYFVTNRISLGIAYGYYDFDGSSSAATNTQTETSWALRVKYYILKRERLLPYVGLAYKFYDAERKTSATTITTDDTGTTFMLGLRYGITERNAAYLEYQLNSYGDKWPNNVDGGSKVVIGLIHQVK